MFGFLEECHNVNEISREESKRERENEVLRFRLTTLLKRKKER